NVSMKNATVYTRDMQGHLLFKDCTNETGFVEHRNLYAIDGAYSVSARYGNRTVSRKLIEVNKTEVITVKCWTNNLTVICIDQDDQFLADYVVLLYDQLVFYSPTNVTAVTNQTGLLVNWTKTDENGTACFSDIWNGTYWIRITSGEIVKEAIIDIQGTKFLIMFCDRAYVALRFTTLYGRTLPGATVFLFDETGSLIFRGHADTDGHIIREGLRLANYTINVVWMGTQVWYGSVDISKERDKTISCMIYRLTLHCVDAFGNSLPRADVTLVKLGSRGERLVLELETDETGSLSLLLPYGSYAVSCSYGIYDGLRMIDLNDDFGLIVTCNVKNIFWVSITAVVVPLVVFTLLLERRKLRTPLEIRKYKTMLSKLESMYRNGLVEYKIYRKLREEYDANIMELGGREMR
ncbi:MAG: hypothetical protein NWF14_00895, partial [Candidatus Bathyarchaeota archaeon]|nr:hypothetical protein [Candidatus Bathyarchaeota archaeon]